LADSFRLTYISETPVNWCAGLGTVLANEEVTAEGRSVRGNFPVFTRRLRQWNMRITAYADRLIDDLDRVDWPESIRAMQRNWIGRSHGAQVTFPVAGLAGRAEASFDVFTTRADTLFGATFCVLSPEHALLSDPTALPEAWPEGAEDAWSGGEESPRAAVSACPARGAGPGRGRAAPRTPGPGWRGARAPRSPPAGPGRPRSARTSAPPRTARRPGCSPGCGRRTRWTAASCPCSPRTTC